MSILWSFCTDEAEDVDDAGGKDRGESGPAGTSDAVHNTLGEKSLEELLVTEVGMEKKISSENEKNQKKSLFEMLFCVP